MGTEFLRPQNCFTERIRVSPASVFPRRNPKSCRKQAIHSPARPSRPARPEPTLVMGQVTILKRGESLDSKRKPNPNANLRKTVSGDVYGTGRLGPEPERVPKIRVSDLKLQSDEYAGSACYNSPSPRALPLPRFSVKKDRFVADSATKDLRRLLRLE